MSLAIDGAHVLCDRRFEVGTVAIDDGTIAAVAFGDDDRRALCASAREVVDGTGCWLVPGLVDAHTHAYGTLLRGTESALPLELWAFYTIAYGVGLDDDAITAALLLHDAECIRSGITGVVDHYPHMAQAHAALAAHERSGMRVLFGAFVQDVSDYDLFTIDVPPALRDLAAVPPVDEPAYEALFADLVATARGASGRVRVALGPNAPQRCSPAIWKLWRRLRERYGVAVHAHALETRAQARIGRQNWPDGGMIAAMDDAGLLDADLSLAHAIWTTPEERALLARRGVAVSHNPLSNLTIGSGIMPLDAYFDAGVTVGIGTDGSNCAGRHDLFETMRAAMTLPRVREDDPSRWPSAADVMTMATTNGMRILGFGNEPSGIVPGAPADLVLVRRDRTGTVLFPNTIDGFVAQAGREAVDSVMVDGAWILRNDRILSFDEGAMLAAVADAHAGIAERNSAVIPAIDAALASVTTQMRPWLAPFEVR
jgi:cytosine/adenosine deaminase-related metal-dependent hydrolase